VTVGGSWSQVVIVWESYPFAARFEGSLIGNAIVGHVVVTSIEPEIRGSVQMPLTLELVP
jgi:hypothetical protein